LGRGRKEEDSDDAMDLRSNPFSDAEADSGEEDDEEAEDDDEEEEAGTRKKPAAALKRPAAARMDEEDEDEDEEGPECEQGAFRDSKVTEFCDKSFPTGKGKTWAVLFYSPSSTSKKAQNMGKVWRALADLVPMHNKRAAVAAIDCSRHRATCEQQGVKKKALPDIRRYAPGASAGTAFEGEPILEDLVMWASKAEGEL